MMNTTTPAPAPLTRKAIRSYCRRSARYAFALWGAPEFPDLLAPRRALVPQVGAVDYLAGRLESAAQLVAANPALASGPGALCSAMRIRRDPRMGNARPLAYHVNLPAWW